MTALALASPVSGWLYKFTPYDIVIDIDKVDGPFLVATRFCFWSVRGRKGEKGSSSPTRVLRTMERLTGVYTFQTSPYRWAKCPSH